MKNIIVSLFVFSFISVFAHSVEAAVPLRREIRETVRENIEDTVVEGSGPARTREEIRETVREEVKEKNQGLIDRVKNFIKKKVRFNARVTGTIATLGEGSMTINSEDGKTYALNITTETKLVRRFGGSSTISEFAVGNKVNVFGKFTDESETAIDVRLIRNISIQKRWGVFFGEVTLKDTGLVIESSNRGTQNVAITGATLKDREENSITFGEIQVGHRVRVKGMWDRSSNQVTEVTEIKDFSLPAKP